MGGVIGPITPPTKECHECLCQHCCVVMAGASRVSQMWKGAQGYESHHLVRDTEKAFTIYWQAPSFTGRPHRLVQATGRPHRQLFVLV